MNLNTIFNDLPESSVDFPLSSVALERIKKFNSITFDNFRPEVLEVLKKEDFAVAMQIKSWHNHLSELEKEYQKALSEEKAEKELNRCLEIMDKHLASVTPEEFTKELGLKPEDPYEDNNDYRIKSLEWTQNPNWTARGIGGKTYQITESGTSYRCDTWWNGAIVSTVWEQILEVLKKKINKRHMDEVAKYLEISNEYY